MKGKRIAKKPAKKVINQYTEMLSVLQKRIERLEKGDVDLRGRVDSIISNIDITINTIVDLLFKKGVFTEEEFSMEREIKSDIKQQVRQRKAGEKIGLYDGLFCEIWFEDGVDEKGNPKRKDVRAYKSHALMLRDDERLEFKELLDLAGQEYSPGCVLTVERLIPKEYKLNPGLAGKKITYHVKIDKCKASLKYEAWLAKAEAQKRAEEIIAKANQVKSTSIDKIEESKPEESKK